MTYEQTSIRMFLSRTEEWAGSPTRDPGVWPAATAEDAELAIDDVCRAITSQGSQFIETWSDPDWVYDLLESESSDDLKGDVGIGAVMLPGMPGSENRLSHLAMLADLRGDRVAERLQLERLLSKGANPWYQARLDELAQNSPGGPS